MNTSQFIKQIWLGKSCKIWRQTMDYKLNDISEDTGYSVATISQFERGLNDNAVIFIWYLSHGFDVTRDFIEPTEQLHVDVSTFNDKCVLFHETLKAGDKVWQEQN